MAVGTHCRTKKCGNLCGEQSANCVDNDSNSAEMWHCPYGCRSSRSPLGERTIPTSGMDTTARLRRVVSKCALREKREAPRLPGAPTIHRIGLKISHKKSSSCSKVIRVDCGNAFSKIAPSCISRRVRALRSLTRSLASASSNRCFACNNFFSFSVIKSFLPKVAQTQKGGS